MVPKSHLLHRNGHTIFSSNLLGTGHMVIGLYELHSVGTLLFLCTHGTSPSPSDLGTYCWDKIIWNNKTRCLNTCQITVFNIRSRAVALSKEPCAFDMLFFHMAPSLSFPSPQAKIWGPLDPPRTFWKFQVVLQSCSQDIAGRLLWSSDKI